VVGRSVPLFPIGVVKELTGLTERRIRYYEEMGLVIPARTKGGHRLYSDGQVKKLKRIKRLLEEGLTLDEVRARFERERDREEEVRRLMESRDVPDTGDVRARFRWRRGGRGLAEEKAKIVGPMGAEDQVRLDSLYPVSDRSELLRAIEREPRPAEKRGEDKDD